MCVGNGLCEGKSIAFGLGAGLAGAIAEVMHTRICLWCWGSKSIRHRVGGSLQFGARLARAVTEVVDSIRVRYCIWSGKRLPRSDGQESSEDEWCNFHFGFWVYVVGKSKDVWLKWC